MRKMFAIELDVCVLKAYKKLQHLRASVVTLRLLKTGFKIKFKL